MTDFINVFKQIASPSLFAFFPLVFSCVLFVFKNKKLIFLLECSLEKAGILFCLSSVLTEPDTSRVDRVV